MAAYMCVNDHVFKRMARLIFFYTGLQLFAPQHATMIQKLEYIAAEFMMKQIPRLCMPKIINTIRDLVICEDL